MGGHGLQAGEVVEGVRSLVGARRVVLAGREGNLVDPGLRVARRRGDVVAARLSRVQVDRGARSEGPRARLGERDGRRARRVRVHPHDVGGRVEGFVADAVRDAVAVLGAEAGRDVVRARHRAPASGEAGAGACGEGGRAALENARGGIHARAGVAAVRGRDDDGAVGVVAVRVRDGAAGGSRDVADDVERVVRRVAEGVRGHDGLRPGRGGARRRERVAVRVVRRGRVVLGRAAEAGVCDRGEVHGGDAGRVSGDVVDREVAGRGGVVVVGVRRRVEVLEIGPRALVDGEDAARAGVVDGDRALGRVGGVPDVVGRAGDDGVGAVGGLGAPRDRVR